jgi:hypothetical protein
VEPPAVVREDIGDPLSQTFVPPVEQPRSFVGNVEHRESARHRAGGPSEVEEPVEGADQSHASVWPCGLESFGEIGDRLHAVTDQRGPLLGIRFEQRLDAVDTFTRGLRGLLAPPVRGYECGGTRIRARAPPAMNTIAYGELRV